jgi:sugar O-acyltransferase (sialic acid O-acetyltransferase NeuD family)
LSSPLYIFGAGGHARELSVYFRALDRSRAIWFVTPDPEGQDCISVDEYRSRLASGDVGESILGAGRCEVRMRMMPEMQPPFATFVHPSAVVYGSVGAGSVVAPNAVVAPGVTVKEHVLVNYCATIGHDTTIGAFSVVAPAAAIGGWCELEEAVYVGAGALVREKLHIGMGAIIAMGAIVTTDVAANTIMMGWAARERKPSTTKGRWLNG